MSIKGTLTLMALVLIVGSYILIAERSRDTADQRRAAARMALRFDPDEVISLRIDTLAGIFVLQKSNDTWRLFHPVQATAESGAIMRILDTLVDLRRSEIITESELRDLKLDASAYGFASPRARLTLNNGRENIVMLIGRDAPGTDQLYMKREDRAEIIVTGKELLSVLPLSVLNLRERRLFGVQPGRVKRIEWNSRDKVFHAARSDDDQWRIDRPVNARGSASAIRQWLDKLYEFRVHEFISDTAAAASLYGFDDPEIQLSIYPDNRPLPHTLKIGRFADINQETYYATLAGQDTVFTVESDMVKWLMNDLSELRDRRLLYIPAPEIGFIQITEADKILQLARNTQNVWEVVSPKRFRADDARIQRVLSAWTGARVEEFIDPPLPDLAAFGLDKEYMTVRFSRQASPTLVGADRDITFMIGLTNAAESVVVSPFPPVYAMSLPARILENISANPLHYRDPVILSVDPASIRRITQITGKNEIAVERTNHLFRATTPGEIPDTDSIQRILALLSRLPVMEYLEEDPRNLAPYGLHDPREQLIIGLTGAIGINRVLLFGNRSLRGGVYAMLRGTDVVFTLSNEMVDALLKPVANSLAPAGASVLKETEP